MLDPPPTPQPVLDAQTADAGSAEPAQEHGLWALLGLNFFMADLQAGIGPFLGVFLLGHGWESGAIGTVMTVGGIAGMAMMAPAGALVDATRRKRLLVIIPGACTLAASALILLSQSFWVVAASQVATAIAGAAIIPAVNAITLGMVGQLGFNRQNGRNQAFNHAGNVAGAALSGWVGWLYGFPAVFILAGVLGLFTIACVLAIPGSAIDHRRARGLSQGASARVGSIATLLENKPLLVLAAALAAFHLGNGAMLPLYGLAVVADGSANPAGFVATTIVVAQAVMVATSLAASRMADTRGYWLVLLISFVALPVRGIVASYMISPEGVYPVQILDGVGAGLQSVAVPGLVARLLNGTGRVNVGQGSVVMVQSIGAALSPALGGWLAQGLGYPVAFLALGSFALVSAALWLGFARTLKPACATQPLARPVGPAIERAG